LQSRSFAGKIYSFAFSTKKIISSLVCVSANTFFHKFFRNIKSAYIEFTTSILVLKFYFFNIFYVLKKMEISHTFFISVWIWQTKSFSWKSFADGVCVPRQNFFKFSCSKIPIYFHDNMIQQKFLIFKIKS